MNYFYLISVTLVRHVYIFCLYYVSVAHSDPYRCLDALIIDDIFRVILVR